jgi:hypothetical protein
MIGFYVSGRDERRAEARPLIALASARTQLASVAPWGVRGARRGNSRGASRGGVEDKRPFVYDVPERLVGMRRGGAPTLTRGCLGRTIVARPLAVMCGHPSCGSRRTPSLFLCFRTEGHRVPRCSDRGATRICRSLGTERNAVLKAGPKR